MSRFIKTAIIVCLFFLSGWLLIKTFQAPVEKARVKNLLASCLSQPGLTANNLDYGCLKSGFKKMVTAGNLDLLMMALENVFMSQESLRPFGTRTCHGPAHTLGEVAVENGIAMGKVFSACERRCDYGCLHGAFVQMMRQTPDFLNDFTSACDQFKSADIDKDLTSCYHIVGHGLTDLLGRDLNKAISYCDQFKEGEGKNNCVEGALMEIVLGTVEGSQPFDAQKNDLAAFCASLPADYSSLCFDFVGYYGYILIPEKAKASELCLKVPQVNRKECFQNLGGIAYFDFRQSVKDLQNFCATLGDYEDNCLLGVVAMDVDFDPEFPAATAICREAKEDFSSACITFLADKVEYAYGQEVSAKLQKELTGWPDSKSITKLRTNLELQIKRDGPEKTYEDLKNYYGINKPHASVLPHLAAHLFGELLYQSQGFDGIRICDSVFTYGCYHGFFNAAVASQGVEVIAGLNQFCLGSGKDINPVACQHGLGHGLAEYYGSGNLSQSLQSCQELGAQNTPFGCVGGVFMEYNFPAMFDGLSVNESLSRQLTDDVYSPCLEVNQEFKRACYFRLTEWWEISTDKNYSQMFDWCTAINNESDKGACLMGVGAALMVTNGFDINKAVEICREDYCRVGASFILTTINQGDETGKICFGACAQKLEKEKGSFLRIN